MPAADADWLTVWLPLGKCSTTVKRCGKGLFELEGPAEVSSGTGVRAIVYDCTALYRTFDEVVLLWLNTVGCEIAEQKGRVIGLWLLGT